jgi:hypothetical protein
MTRTTPSRWISLHLSQIFLTDARTFILLNLPDDSAPREISFRELDFHPVARQQPDPILLPCPGGVRQNPRFVTQFEPVQQARQLLDHSGFYCLHGLVKTQGPLSVTATQCSK